MAFQFQVTYDPMLATVRGLFFPFQSDYLLTGLGLLTGGLVYGKADIWVPAETCLTVTWTNEDNL